MAVVIILFLIFVIMGVIFLFGKGSFLIAGYNTADKKEKEKYDEKKLNLCFACFSFGMAAVIGACGYMDTEAFAVQVGLRQGSLCCRKGQCIVIIRIPFIDPYFKTTSLFEIRIW